MRTTQACSAQGLLVRFRVVSLRSGVRPFCVTVGLARGWPRLGRRFRRAMPSEGMSCYGKEVNSASEGRTTACPRSTLGTAVCLRLSHALSGFAFFAWLRVFCMGFEAQHRIIGAVAHTPACPERRQQECAPSVSLRILLLVALCRRAGCCCVVASSPCTTTT